MVTVTPHKDHTDWHETSCLLARRDARASGIKQANLSWLNAYSPKVGKG